MGWGRLRTLDESLSSFSVECIDARGRSHELSMIVSPNHPFTPPVLAASLPSAFSLDWHPSHSTLASAVSQFEDTLRGFQGLWDALDELDSTTCVLEPKDPNRAATHRRIAIGGCGELIVFCDCSSVLQVISAVYT